MLALFRKAHYLSLDIVLGAVILLRFFSSQFSSDPSLEVYVLLASSVWLIYTIDHLRDAKMATRSQRARYQFHLRNERILKVIVGMVLSICIYCLFHVPSIILLAGSFLVLLSSIYLAIQQMLAKWGMKEFYISIIYTSGILLAPYLYAESVSIEVYVLLFLLTFSNLILFSWFEREDDLADGFASIATVFSNIWLQRTILAILSLGIAFTLLSEMSVIHNYFLIAFLVYAFLFIKHDWVKKKGLYRLIGDGVFLLPILFEFFS